MNINEKFYKSIIEKNLINEKELDFLIKRNNDDAFEVLLNLLSANNSIKTQLGQLWAKSINTIYADFKSVLAEEELVNSIPQEYAMENKVVALSIRGDVITVASSNPTNDKIIKDLEKSLKNNIYPIFAFPDDILDFLHEHYSKNSDKNESGNDSKEVLLKSVQEIPSSVKKEIISGVKGVFDKAASGKPIDKELVINVADTVVNDITNKIDLKKCINQLRVNDEYTYSHSLNTAILSSIFAKSLGFSLARIKEITLAALLHDIGLLKIPKNILYKEGSVSEEEKDLIKKHTLMGVKIIAHMGLSQNISEVALNHHEYIDGSGYQGYTEDEISLNSQIVSLVNLYDNLITDKPNKDKVSIPQAINFLMFEAKSMFNPNLLLKFLDIVYRENNDGLKEIFKSIVL